MVIVVFRSRFKQGVDVEAYGALDAEMCQLVAAQPGFVSIETFEDPDGRRVSLVIFESDEAAVAWRGQPAHRAAQRRGREEFYAWYSIHATEVIRSHELNLTATAPTER